eukprot:SM002269S07326  [mRNA]  locus=s2269:306:759:- [translate_table: standard]
MDPRAMTLAERRACERFVVGDLALECGRVLPGAWLAFRVWGCLDAARANAVLYPTCYAGTHWENDWLIGCHKLLAGETTRALSELRRDAGR